MVVTCSSHLRANAVGRRAAERFRQRFGLDMSSFRGLHPDYADVHDYVHTLLGCLPGPWEDEWRVLQHEQAILDGRAPLPRGLERVEE